MRLAIFQDEQQHDAAVPIRGRPVYRREDKICELHRDEIGAEDGQLGAPQVGDLDNSLRSHAAGVM